MHSPASRVFHASRETPAKRETVRDPKGVARATVGSRWVVLGDSYRLAFAATSFPCCSPLMASRRGLWWADPGMSISLRSARFFVSGLCLILVLRPKLKFSVLHASTAWWFFSVAAPDHLWKKLRPQPQYRELLSSVQPFFIPPIIPA